MRAVCARYLGAPLSAMIMPIALVPLVPRLTTAVPWLGYHWLLVGCDCRPCHYGLPYYCHYGLNCPGAIVAHPTLTARITVEGDCRPGHGGTLRLLPATLAANEALHCLCDCRILGQSPVWLNAIEAPAGILPHTCVARGIVPLPCEAPRRAKCHPLACRPRPRARR